MVLAPPAAIGVVEPGPQGLLRRVLQQEDPRVHVAGPMLLPSIRAGAPLGRQRDGLGGVLLQEAGRGEEGLHAQARLGHKSVGVNHEQVLVPAYELQGHARLQPLRRAASLYVPGTLGVDALRHLPVAGVGPGDPALVEGVAMELGIGAPSVRALLRVNSQHVAIYGAQGAQFVVWHENGEVHRLGPVPGQLRRRRLVPAMRVGVADHCVIVREGSNKRVAPPAHLAEVERDAQLGMVQADL
mmetsp:Transcript_41667/g.129665  ORF Transcript_41667/g.129665 Transcript_41667/m.129665 type:complete len:242 (+) Transcript_41667:180-905(+)